jgi:CBS domain-containing protein
MAQGTKVRDIMKTEVVTVEPETSVNLVARLMAHRGISGIPVVAAGQVLGIVTELDVIERNTRFEPPAFFQILDGRIPLETPSHFRKRLRHMLGATARDVMTEDVVTVAPDEPVENVAEILVKRRVNPLPVVEEGRLVGIVSRADIIEMMSHDLDEPEDA